RGAVRAAVALESRATRARIAKYRDSVRLWDDVVELRPAHARGFVNRAMLLVSRGELDRAEPDIGRAEQIQPGNPDVMFLRAVLDMRAGRASEALERLDVVATATVADARVYGLRGDAMRALGRHADAAQAYRNAAKRAPSARYLASLGGRGGRAAVDAGDSAGALAAFEAALAADPTLAEAGLGLAEARSRGAALQEAPTDGR
ncbi:MAG: tetratricopeptide repeat protein, partial [Phycisphaerales bacterium]